MEKGTISLIILVSAVMVLTIPILSAEADPPPTGWGDPQIINSQIYGNAGDPSISMIDSGEAMCVWTQSDFSRNNIWASHFLPLSGWGIPELIELDNTGWAGQSHVSMNGSGDAVAVWVQNDGSYNRVWSNHYTHGEGWGTAEIIEMNDGHAYSPRVSTDPSGNAVAVWYQHDGSWNSIWANRYTGGTGWGTAVLLENKNTGNAMFADVATDRYGNAMAVWIQHEGSLDNVYCNRYTTGASWNTPQLIEQNDDGSAKAPKIVMSPSGSAVAIWAQDDGARFNIWSNAYSTFTGWGSPELIETDNSGGANDPDLSMNKWGDTIAVWDQSDGIMNNIWANTYSTGSGWDTAQLVEEVNEGQMRIPKVAIDQGGNAVAVWNQDIVPVWNIWSNRYVAGEGWGTPGPIETYNPSDALEQQIASDAEGNTIAVWSQFDGERRDVLSNRYDAPDRTPPMLAVDFPWEGSISTNSSAVFSGMTEPGAMVIIDGFVVHTNEYGVFSSPIPLQFGRNDVVVISIDPSGNSVQVTRTVYYESPVEDMMDRIVEIENDISSIKSSFKGLEDRTSYLEENSSNMSIDASEIASLLENLTLMKGRLGSLENDLSSLHEVLASLNETCGEEVIALMDASIAGLESEVQDAKDRIDGIETDVLGLEGANDLKDDVNSLKRSNSVLTVITVVLSIMTLILLVMVLVILSRRKDVIEE